MQPRSPLAAVEVDYGMPMTLARAFDEITRALRDIESVARKAPPDSRDLDGIEREAKLLVDYGSRLRLAALSIQATVRRERVRRARANARGYRETQLTPAQDRIWQALIRAHPNPIVYDRRSKRSLDRLLKDNMARVELTTRQQFSARLSTKYADLRDASLSMRQASA
jgi:hypothetical protein